MFKDLWQKTWGKIVIVLLFGFAVYSNIRIGFQNYQLNQQVQAEQNKVSQIDSDNQKLSLLLSYYNSPSFQDVEARSRLGMKLPDETVYTVKGITNQQQSTDPTKDFTNTIFQVSGSTSSPAPAPDNFSKWLNYFQDKK